MSRPGTAQARASSAAPIAARLATPSGHSGSSCSPQDEREFTSAVVPPTRIDDGAEVLVLGDDDAGDDDVA